MPAPPGGQPAALGRAQPPRARKDSSGKTATTPAPFTPLMHSTATPHHSAACRGPSRPVRNSTSGRTAQGSTRAGQHLAAEHARPRPATAATARRPGRRRRPATGRQVERAGDVPDALVGNDEQERRPEALRHPVGHPGRVAGEEERPLREQVAVRLVLELAERRVGFQRWRVRREEATGVGGQVELGVPGGASGLLEEATRQEEEPDEPATSEPRPGPYGCAPISATGWFDDLPDDSASAAALTRQVTRPITRQVMCT